MLVYTDKLTEGGEAWRIIGEKFFSGPGLEGVWKFVHTFLVTAILNCHQKPGSPILLSAHEEEELALNS